MQNYYYIAVVITKCLCVISICLSKRLMSIPYNIIYIHIYRADVQFPHILVRKLHTQACEIVAGTKRKLCKKFQVDIFKTKKDRSAHAQLRIL